jgi:hypothetical protein
MYASMKTVPLAAVIIVSALSGALASAVVGRTAIAATAAAPTPTPDPRLTNLLNYVTVDASGNVTIKASNVSIKTSGGFKVQNGSNEIDANAAGVNIKGTLVQIN